MTPKAPHVGLGNPGGMVSSDILGSRTHTASSDTHTSPAAAQGSSSDTLQRHKAAALQLPPAPIQLC